MKTIVSLITPPLNAAVAVIRMSGDEAKTIAQEIFSRPIEKPNHVYYGNIIDGKEIVDQVLLTYFASPKSFTGEDVVEISTHGSMLIANQVIELIISKGARLAERGEFSSRAYYNNKIDLVQAEAILSTIEANTLEAKKLALYSLNGETSSLIKPLIDNLASLLSNIEVNIDYILGLVKKYHDSNMEDKEILVSIQKAIMASPDLRNKKDLIMAFIDSLDQDSNVYADFESFMNSKKKEELDKIITEENLNKEETYNFIQKSFEQGRVETNGTEVSTILPPMSMFTPTNDRQEKKNKVIDKLLEFFDKFFSITGKYGE